MSSLSRAGEGAERRRSTSPACRRWRGTAASTCAARSPMPAASAAFSTNRSAISSALRPPIVPRPVGGEAFRDHVAHGRPVGSVERGQRVVRGRRLGGRWPGDQPLQPLRVAEGAGEPPPPRRVEVERGEHGGEEAGVADPDRRLARRRGALAAASASFSTSASAAIAVGAAERFDAGLQELARLVGALAEDRAEIGVVGPPLRRRRWRGGGGRRESCSRAGAPARVPSAALVRNSRRRRSSPASSTNTLASWTIGGSTKA